MKHAHFKYIFMSEKHKIRLEEIESKSNLMKENKGKKNIEYRIKNS